MTGQARILTIGKYYPPFEGGIESYTRDICEELAKSYAVTTIVYSHTGADSAEFINGVRVRRFRPQCTWNGQPIALQMLRALDLSAYDLVHFHAPNFFANAIVLAKLASQNPNMPVVITHHMEVHGRRLLRAMVLPLYHVLALRSETVIVTSRKNADISRDLPRGARTTTIPMGISADEFRLTEVERNRALDWRRSLVGEAPTIGFIGRHVRYKGLEVLIEALTYLPGAHALIGGVGPLHEKLKEKAAALGVGARAHFLGHLSHADKRRMLAASDVFAFPSTEVTEAFGVAQLEAMAAGVPVIASNLPTGVTDVAIDRETALLARPGDPVDLAKCLGEILSDRALAAQLAAAARRHVTTHFAKKSVIRDTCEVIERALRHMRSRAHEIPVPESVVASSAT